MVDYAIVIPTVIGSTLSAIGAGFILICYSIFPQKHHFRHALIINLALSGKCQFRPLEMSCPQSLTLDRFPQCPKQRYFRLLRRGLGQICYPLACMHPQWIRRPDDCPGQLRSGASTHPSSVLTASSQATDLNILAIALVTLLTLREVIYIPDESVLPKILICGSVWLLPLITSECRLPNPCAAAMRHGRGANLCDQASRHSVWDSTAPSAGTGAGSRRSRRTPATCSHTCGASSSSSCRQPSTSTSTSASRRGTGDSRSSRLASAAAVKVTRKGMIRTT